MDTQQYVDAIRRDGIGTLDAVAAVPAGTPVPSCPGWDAERLLRHLGEVHRFWTQVVEHRLQDPDDVAALRSAAPAAPPPEDLREWYSGGLHHLLDVVGRSDPSWPVWTWSHQHDVAFVIRRMAHETAMHRWDADQAARRPSALDAELSSDGIDEWLEHWVAPSPRRDPVVGGSVHLHCTDVAGEWLAIEDDDGAITVTHEHAKGTCALRGAAADLLLVIWDRRPVDSVDVIGDGAVAQRLVQRAARP